VGGCLHGGIVHQLLHELVETDGIVAEGAGIAFGARHLEQLADQRVEAVGLLLNTIEGGFGIVAGARQFDGDAKAGEGRAEFVGDIEEQAAFGESRVSRGFAMRSKVRASWPSSSRRTLGAPKVAAAEVPRPFCRRTGRVRWKASQ
jgi:hypothetical protein